MFSVCISFYSLSYFFEGKQCLVAHPDMAADTIKWLWYEREGKTPWERSDLNVTEDPCIQLWTWKPESISGTRFRVCLRCHHRLPTDGFIYLTCQATSKAGCRVKVRERQTEAQRGVVTTGWVHCTSIQRMLILILVLYLQVPSLPSGKGQKLRSTWCFWGQTKSSCYFINYTGSWRNAKNNYYYYFFYLNCYLSNLLVNFYNLCWSLKVNHRAK